ncbi:MAG: energy-coupling factor ABC transporter ATP-binding protein [Coriobacteriales bacterium]|nr:energy-coupling factor ABC transporter ATP-binding protein [Coriobacteriales bacterium]
MELHDKNIHPSIEHTHSVAGDVIIEFEDFSYSYFESGQDDQNGQYGVDALRNINLQISRGNCVVLMGYNGSGKTTLLKAINGLIFASAGTYKFNDQIVDSKSMKDQIFAKALHSKIGYVFQDSDSSLFCSSVEEEIAFGPAQMGLGVEDIKKRVEDMCKLFEIEHLKSRAPYHLSGGEKKKVAIACALSINPDVLCFDEPLNGLDIKTRDKLMQVLRDLKEAGKTLIIATHDQSLADELADFFVYMGAHHKYSDKPHTHINMQIGTNNT